MLSQANVRHVKAGVSIEELAEDIARRTLLSSITVRPVLHETGAETGIFEIPAGGRRYRALERLVSSRRPDMVLLHGGSPRGAEKIAACWADNRGCTQIVFKPDWTRHRKAAPFKRNDEPLALLPIGLIVVPGSGITDNLADKARALGIPLFDFRPKAGASA